MHHLRSTSEFVFLRDLVLANDVSWLDFGIRGSFGGVFTVPDPPLAPKEKKGDLAFLSLGQAGILVFDVAGPLARPKAP